VSRIAEARARAGFTLLHEETVQWDAARKAADVLLEDAGKRQIPNPKSQTPNPKSQTPNPKSQTPNPNSSRPETVDFLSRRSESAETAELEAALRRIFLSPGSTVRSLLFCSVPGDGTTDVAWRSAELLAAQTGKPIAFVEKPSHRIAPAPPHGLIFQIEWSEEDNAVDSAASNSSGTVGEQIPDLLPRFAYVLANAAPTTSDDILSLARQVDGVVVIVRQNETSVDAAQSLVTSLRSAPAALLGTVVVADTALI
jgi:hydroxymethylglutaryl-CoA reductase (NADPH)